MSSNTKLACLFWCFVVCHPGYAQIFPGGGVNGINGIGAPGGGVGVPGGGVGAGGGGVGNVGVGGNGLNMDGNSRHRSENSIAPDSASQPVYGGGRVDPPEDATEHLQAMQLTLKLSAEQQVLWQRYFDVTKRAIDDSRRWRNRDHRPDKAKPAPDLSAELVQELQDRLAALEDIEGAGKSLYATLSPDQRAIADKHMAAVVSALAGNPVIQFDLPS